jgi:integrase
MSIFVELVDTPVGQEGRSSKSLTFGQAVALIQGAQSYGLYAYVVLSLLVGVQVEEARALRWDHVDLEGDPDATPRRRLAVRTCPRRHQDEEVPALFGIAHDGGGSAR